MMSTEGNGRGLFKEKSHGRFARVIEPHTGGRCEI
jgi:hypothetical protein